MKVVASTDEYTIYQRRDGRYAVKGADRKAINADAKVAILLQHELITAPAPKAPEPEAPAEEAPAEEAGEPVAEETEAEAAQGEEASEEEDKA